jgi:hypothetical protein
MRNGAKGTIKSLQGGYKTFKAKKYCVKKFAGVLL